MAILISIRWAPVILLAVLAGCATTPSPGGEQEAFREAQRAAAISAEEAGDYAAAIAYWRSLKTLTPDDAAVATRIRELEARARQRAQARVARGQKHYAAGNSQRGDRDMLEALALQPGLEDALLPLRRSISAAAHGRQAEKVAGEYENQDESGQQRVMDELALLLADGRYQQVVTMVDSVEDGGERRNLLLRAHTGLADQARRAGNRDLELEQLTAAIASGGGRELQARRKALARELSDEAYRQGLTVLQTDLAQAIEHLERAVTYDPANLAAKEKLDQAMVIKRNLDRIRGN